MQDMLAETWAAEKNLCFPEQPDRLQRPSLLQRLQVKPVRTSAGVVTISQPCSVAGSSKSG